MVKVSDAVVFLEKPPLVLQYVYSGSVVGDYGRLYNNVFPTTEAQLIHGLRAKRNR